MPEHAETRRDTEAAIVGALWPVFRDFAPRLESGGGGYQDLQAAVQQAVQPSLEQVFVVAYLLLWQQVAGSDDRGLALAEARTLGLQSAAAAAQRVAAGVALNAQRELAAGRLPADILSRGRAEVIAATETTAQISAGELAARRAIGAERGGPPGVTGHRDGLIARWVTERDARVCPICRPLDGVREEGWIDRFPSGPPAHPNCRCFLEYSPVSDN